MSRGRSYHADYGEFYIGGETSTRGKRHLHGGGDLVIAVTCPPPGDICTGETLYNRRPCSNLPPLPSYLLSFPFCIPPTRRSLENFKASGERCKLPGPKRPGRNRILLHRMLAKMHLIPVLIAVFACHHNLNGKVV